MSDEVVNPDGMVTIRFLLVNGNSFNFQFPTDATIKDVRTKVLEEKPQDLVDYLNTASQDFPSVPEEIRILYLGKYLEDQKTIEGCGLTDTVNTVHIHIKPVAPAKEEKPEKPTSDKSCCTIM